MRPPESIALPPAPVQRPPALQRLRADACRFTFDQAVWLLERYLTSAAVSIGQRGPVSRERLRFRPALSMGFPATDVARLREWRQDGTDEPLFVIDVTFLGLYGVTTPLPLHYSIDILRSTQTSATLHEAGAAPAPDSERSPTRDFLDLIHHRVISLFYRACLKYRYDRVFPLGERDTITEYLKQLIGCLPGYDHATLGVAPLALLRYAGIFTQRPRSATTLAGMLVDYFPGIPVDVHQFCGHWVTLDEDQLNHVGRLNSRLGEDLTVGEQVYDLTGSFTIAIGPVDWYTYLTFLPDGERYGQTCALARLYCNDPLAFSLRVDLLPDQVPPTQLTSDDTAGRLGLTSWVRTGPLGATSVTFDTATWRPPATEVTPESTPSPARAAST